MELCSNYTFNPARQISLRFGWGKLPVKEVGTAGKQMKTGIEEFGPFCCNGFGIAGEL